jgi:hypothetical protein
MVQAQAAFVLLGSVALDAMLQQQRAHLFLKELLWRVRRSQRGRGNDERERAGEHDGEGKTPRLDVVFPGYEIIETGLGT